MKKDFELYHEWTGLDGDEKRDRPDNLADHIAWLSSMNDQVPVEHRKSATIRITADEHGYLTYAVEWSREETAEEISEREREEADRKEDDMAQRRGRALLRIRSELREFPDLKQEVVKEILQK